MIGAAVASALLAAAAIRVPSLVGTLLAAYLALVANLALATLVLSPANWVTRTGLGGAEAVALAVAALAWWLRGRPVPSLAPVRTAAGIVLRDPVTLVFAGFVVVLLVYELVLAVTVPPNNGDALGYHLPKAAAWAQHGGLVWIPDAPTVRINAFQPLAEQQILFLLVAGGGSGALVALPQYVAQLAILLAVYGAARRLGFDLRRSALAALLLATFSLPALEATTAQNDLVVASFPIVAACLLLGVSTAEAALAGAAVGIGIGAKLTSLLVAPVLVALALLRGRRALAASAVGAVTGLVAIGMWGYVLNAVHTGHVLGAGTGTVEDRASPSYPGSVANFFDLLYGLMDVSVLWKGLIDALALGAVAVGGAVLWIRRRAAPREALADAAGSAVPFLAPMLVLGGAASIAFVADRWGFPIRGPGGVLAPVNENLNQIYTHIANEDYSAFGPVGIVSLVLAIALTVRAVLRRTADLRQLALAAALPFFLVVISLVTFWNPFLIRFFLVPAALAAPLLAHLFRSRFVTAAYAVAAALAITLTLTRVQTKPLSSPYGLGRPWNLTQADAMTTNSRTEYARALTDYRRLVPPRACVGALLGSFDPSYLLFEPRLDHRVVYLPGGGDPVSSALRNGLFYVVVNPSQHPGAVERFAQAGWKVRSLGGYWALAADAHGGVGSC